MSSITTLFLSYLLLYKYLTLFLLVFAIAIVVPLPANVFLLAAGAFASLGYMSLPLAILVAVVANVLGDVVDYWLARYFGPKILRFFKITEHRSVVRMQNQLRNHAKFTIFITRFAGPVDLIVSLSSGIAQVRFTTFLLYDFLGNFLSNVAVLGVGYAAGISWQSFSGTVDLVSTIILVVIIIIFIAWYFLRKRKRALAEKKSHQDSSQKLDLKTKIM
jgi:membrane-associated protein